MRQLFNDTKALVCLGLLLLASSTTLPPANALDSDAKQVITIEADSAELNRVQRKSVFRGKVTVEQGTTKIEADELTLYFTEDEKIQKAIAHGNLAHYQTLPQTGKPLFHARAQTIQYNLQTDEIELDGNAIAQQGANRFSGSHIRYHMRSQTLLSSKQNKNSGRTTIVLDPSTEYWSTDKS